MIPGRRLASDAYAADAAIRRAFHQTWPEYRPTPIVSLDTLARRLRVGSIHVKDEGRRLGLGSFKVLGSSWALHQRTKRSCKSDDKKPWPVDVIRTALRRSGPIGLCTASDGNHGLAIAVLARRLRLSSVVYLPSGIDRWRVQQIIDEGAQVRSVSGSYVDAVAAARAASHTEGLWYCPDTALLDPDPEELTFASDVISGYGTLWEELIEHLHRPPELILLQAGVGAFAASGVLGVRRQYPSVRIVAVEPVGSACVSASIANRQPTTVPDRRTAMDGLRCQAVSAAAWPILRDGLFGTLLIDDDWADEAVAALTDAGVSSRPSGAAGLAGLIQAARQAQSRSALSLTSNTRVVVVNTEGPRNPDAPAQEPSSPPC